jgi:hypothetical protein
MRLYPGQARSIAREICERLLKDEAIEIEAERRLDAEADLDAVIIQYIRTDREITQEARDAAKERGQGNSALGKIKRRLAQDRGFAIGDDAINWLMDQLIEMLLHSHNIEEVYVEDRDLRKVIAKILQAHTQIESELDKEVRGKLKNLEEGSSSWEIEYEKAMMNLKRQKGLTDKP